MSARMQVRRDTAAAWTTANPVLAAGELGYESDTKKLKMGDGVTAWATLHYLAPAAVGAAAYNNAGTSIPDNSEPAVPLAAEEFDTDGFHDNATNNTRLTVPAGLGGFYLCTAQTTYTYNSSGSRTAALFLNGTKLGEGGVQASISSSPIYTRVIQLAAGDYLEMKTYQNSGGALALLASGANRLAMLRLGI